MEKSVNACVPAGCVTAAVHEQGVVLFHAGNGSILAANGTGAAVWRGLERRLPIETIAGEISREYGIARNTVMQDMSRFLIQLQRHGLIDRVAQ